MGAMERTGEAGARTLELDDGALEVQGRKAAQVENTRRALLDAARELFTENGYQATRTEDVVQRAGLTRGALYHHFRDKEDLFRAVFDEVQEEVTATLHRRASDPSSSSWELFRANSALHLEAAASNAAYRRIVLIDGPAVFGAPLWLEHRGGPEDKVAEYLRGAVVEGSIDKMPIEPLTQLLTSLGVGSAMYLAQADEPEVARAQIESLTERLLAGLSTAPRGTTKREHTDKKKETN